MSAPRLIVGLGNPGREYADTRHNAGFWLVDCLAQRFEVCLVREARFHGLMARSRERGCWLLAPQTYMNRSGLAVAALARFYRIEPHQVIVLHDELDIRPGELRLRFGGGLGGHNGLKDIAAHLGTQNFWRLRIGIGHPGDREEVVNYVLRAPLQDEQSAIEDALKRALAEWNFIERGEYPAAMQKLNVRSQAQPSGEHEDASGAARS